MPQFDPGTSQVATVPTTVKPVGLACLAELYLVSNATKVASSGEISFVSTGAQQAVSLPITMPELEGTYPVYIDVYADGELIAAYQALEDVVVKIPAPAFVYSNESAGYIDKPGTSYCWLLFECDITNPTSKTETEIITLWHYSEFADEVRSEANRPACDEYPCPVCKDPGQIELTLAPGESHHYRYCGGTCSYLYTSDQYFWLRDDRGGESAHKHC